MPSVSAHLAQAESNVLAYDAIPEAHPDWRATVLFYAAMHYMEAAFASENKHFREHYPRESYIKDQPEHRGIWKYYHRLKDESVKARYLALGGGQKAQFSMTAAQVHEQLRKKCLKAIQGHVEKFLEKARAAAEPSAEA